MAAEDMVVVDPQGARVAGTNNPPSETPIFTGVFAARPDVMAVFHLHLEYATLFSVVGKPLRPIGVTGAPFGEEVPVHADPTLIQRPEQGAALARSLGDRLAVILRGHGAVIVGASIEEAFAASVILREIRQDRARGRSESGLSAKRRFSAASRNRRCPSAGGRTRKYQARVRPGFS